MPRSPRLVLPALLVALTAALAASPALAAWPHDPNVNVPLCTQPGDQLGTIAVSDGAGGAILAWTDSRSGVTHVYAQRVSAAGVALWTTDGVQLSNFTGAELNPAIMADGAGGAIIAYQDLHGSFYDIYAQRVNSAGVIQWPAAGQPVCQAVQNQITPKLVSDGAGGAIITWSDVRNGTTQDIFAQRVNGSGTPQWTTDGVAICQAANNQTNPVICSDNAGGAIITWADLRLGSINVDIYAQRVNASGNVLWTTDGVAVCSAVINQSNPSIVSDGGTGAIVTWQDIRNNNDYDIYAERINASGTSVWTVNGVAVAVLAGNQATPLLVADADGGAIIAWTDGRNGTYNQIYAQHVSTTGVVLWAANGIAVGLTTTSQSTPAVAADGSGGAFLAWTDSRAGSNTDVYAQHVTSGGALVGPSTGIGVSTANLTQESPALVRDASGGAIVAWEDLRSGLATYDIYAQRLDQFGYLGNPEPLIASVNDVPNDQGGKVKLAWYASYLDGNSDPNLAAYDVYRSAPGSVAFAAARRGARLMSSFAARPAPGQPTFVVNPPGAQLYAWEYLNTVTPVHFLSAYGAIEPTTGDSTSLGNPPTIFMVVGRNSSGSMYWLSAPDSGYSADDLAPIAPAPFTGAYSAGATHLHWGANHEADLAGYRLYRGSSAGFVPGPDNLVSAQSDTGFADAGSAGSFYKLSAVDVHGNESPFALLAPSGTTAVGPGTPRKLAFALASANPGRGEATFRFALPSAGVVRVAVFDLLGREVRVLANGPVAAGEGSARWDGRDAAGHAVDSGVYLARLSVQGRELTTRLVLIR